MSIISCREIHFNQCTSPGQVDDLIDNVKQIIEEMKLPATYNVKVFKNIFSCCGTGGLDLILEVVGPDEETLKAIDLRATSRVLEFCEKQGYGVGCYHSLGKFELIEK
ncbi:MAG: hypothetical protein ABSC20_07020 [Candidatus Bathyarchaeia archaeon]|jgi:hypothetical protein